MEALRLQQDNLCVELHALQLENENLREQNPEVAVEIDACTEAVWYRHESEQLTAEVEEIWKKCGSYCTIVMRVRRGLLDKLR